MEEFQYVDLPEMLTLSEAVEILADMEEEHRRLYDQATVKVQDPIHPIEHIVATVLRRSIANMRGFLLLIDSGNEFAAMPLIRMQLDSVLRISAFRLVDDAYDLANHMIEGKKFDKYKNPNSKVELHDRALREPLEAKYEYINNLYEETSGYVHLSRDHMVRVLKGWDNPNRGDDDRLEFAAVDDLPLWREKDKRQAMLFFCVATRFLLDEAKEVLSAPRF